MSNRFVSGGTIAADGSEAADAPEAPERAQLPGKRNQWEAVTEELENDRKRREEERLKAASGEEMSLYDKLQASKAEKQAAFEEQIKLKNQFRPLDDDEAEFLQEMRETERKKDELVRRETEDGLRAFRERQRRGSVGEPERDEDAQDNEDWTAGRKRKRKEKEVVKGLVKRRTSDTKGEEDAEKKHDDLIEKKEKEAKPADTQKKGLSLVDYGSDDSD